ncbi:MAG: hypothetical protein JJU21_03045 [Salinarimonas sp.]|nr:hypothetical protein [Salinarimonas sp.]
MSGNMEKLMADLDAAADAFERDKATGALQSFRALVQFLDSERVGARRMLPVAWLAASLNDAQSSAGQKPFHDAHTWAFAAAAVDLLKQTGMEIGSAAQEVARSSGREFDADQLLEFRKNCRKGRARREAIDAYHWCISQQGPRLATLDNEGQRKAIDHMIASLFGK